MKATITLQQLWFNATLLDFFFRKQARETFEELVKHVGANNSAAEFRDLENRIEDDDTYRGDLNLFEEDCYNETVEYLLGFLGYDEEK